LVAGAFAFLAGVLAMVALLRQVDWTSQSNRIAH